MNIQQIAQKLENGKTIAVFSHIRPDGDTVGSALGVKLILEALGKQVSLFCDGEIPAKFGEFGDISAFSHTYQGKHDLYLAVDCADESRVGAFSYLFSGKNETLLIDHHVSNTRFAKYSFVEDCAATCELIVLLAQALGVTITKEIANALLMGISTDTGHFAHNNVTDRTLKIAGILVEAGGEVHRIARKMFKSQSPTRAKLFAEVMGQMRFFHGGKVALISVSTEQLNYYNAKQDITEGFIDFPLSVEGVEIAISTMQVGAKSFKVSFRSKGKSDVNRLAGVFGGGGHVMASGCMLNGYQEDVWDKLVFQAGNYLED